MNKTQAKQFLSKAIVDPNSFIEKQLVEQGTNEYFETRTIEYMGELARIRARMKPVKGRDALVEEYEQTALRAINSILISVSKIRGPEKPKRVKKEIVNNGTEGTKEEEGTGSNNSG